jgi:uncharacterized protein
MYRRRSLTGRLERLAGTFPAIVVAGARQVGKSTLLGHVFGDRATTIVFDPSLDVGNARTDPDLFLETHPPPLILDEIQYAPELVGALKRHVDRNRQPGQYLLTGSQQWNVLNRIAESLAGRAVFLDLEGFSLAELAAANPDSSWLCDWLGDSAQFLAARHARLRLPMTAYDLVWRGCLPDATQIDIGLVPDFHTAYFRTYLERDVRLLSEVSDWHSFSRFVRVAAALTGQEINHSQLGRDIGITPQTARRWLALLAATFQWFEVPAYSGNAVKRVSLKPKGYFADTGLACSAQAISSPTTLGGHPLWGSLFETYVAAELRKQMVLLSPPPRLHHWRSTGGAEVDFLLERDGMFFPIEVKAKSRPSRTDISGIRAFRQAHPHLKIAKGLVVAPTESIEQLSEDDYSLPWDIG